MQGQESTINPSSPPQVDGASSSKPLVVLLVALAAMLGAWPFLLFVELARFLPLVGIGAALIAGLSVRKLQLPPAEAPTTGEWLLGGWSLLFFGALIGGEGFLFYGLLFGGVRLVAWLGSLAGWPLTLDGGRIATVGSSIVAAVFVGLAGHSATSLLQKLYPGVAGTRSPFFPLASRPQRVMMVGAGLGLGLVLALWLLEPRSLTFTLGSTIALIYSSLPLARLGERESRRDEARFAEAVERLFSAAGYRLTRSPVTGNPEVDPLLSRVDYLATSGERGYAVEVKMLNDAERDVGWTTASELLTAARALQSAMRAHDGPPAAVEPLLVLVGGRIDTSLRVFSDEQGVKLTHIAEPARLNDLAVLSESVLRERALELLAIPPGGQSGMPHLRDHRA